MPDSLDQNSEETSRRGLIASAAVVMAILSLGVFLIFAPSDDEASPAPGTSPVAQGTKQPTAEPEGNFCGLKDDPTATPPAIGPEATWALQSKLAVPSSATAGPGKTEDGVGYCYARSPEGALMAAAHVYTWDSPRMYRTLVARSLAAGPGVAIFEASMASSNHQPSGAGGAQIAGYRFVSYSPTAATVVIAISTSGSFVEHALDFVWEERDWRVVLADGGDFRSMPRAIPNLAGFVPWSGV